MNWADIGGKAQSLHVVIEWNYGIYVRILCKHHMTQHNRARDNRQLPHCKQCISALKKLIQESSKVTQLEILAPFSLEEVVRIIPKRRVQ
ncbi:hypothetical protein LCGC14_2977440 [marine sediment metagenome]|uniref:Uncharacterized protein n=1 Tax=marine sediment metagenome TaxID=412755 RepID=A0A0F8ZYV0_9ZZZZ